LRLCLRNPVAILDRRRERLLHEYVATELERTQGDLRVRVGRGQDVDRVQARLRHISQSRKRLQPEPLRQRGRAHFVQLANPDDPDMGAALEAAHVELGDPSSPDETHPKLYLRCHKDSARSWRFRLAPTSRRIFEFTLALFPLSRNGRERLTTVRNVSW